MTTPTTASTPSAPGLAELPVVVVGAGPVGLAAAAHLLERGLEPLVLEAGAEVGAAVAAWGHVRLFSPWRYDLDAAAVRLLEPTGWRAPRPTALPTGAELVEDYLAPLAATPALASRIRTRARVVAVSRSGLDVTRSRGRADTPFLVRVVQGAPDGTSEVVDLEARAVLDASGTWSQPNPLGVSGLPATGEAEAAPYLLGALPDVLGADRDRVAGRHVLVVGAGHSATNTLLHLVQLQGEDPAGGPATRITWAVRGPSAERTFGGGDRDGLPARGALGDRLRRAVAGGRVQLRTGVAVRGLRPDADGPGVTVLADTPDGRRELAVDVVVAATGFRPDLSLLRELRLDLDPAVEAPRRLAPLIDPEHHSCGTVPPHGADVLAHPEPGFFVVGTKSYGRAPTFLLATGYEQVRSVAAHLAGDAEAAADVRLDLPATGVCSADGPAPQEAGDLVTVGFATGSAHGRQAEATC